MSEKREKFYTVSARLVFSTIMVLLIVALILGLSIAINKGPIVPILGLLGSASTTTIAATNPATTSTTTTSSSSTSTTVYTTSVLPPPVAIVTCTPLIKYDCKNATFNYTTGVLTVALSQDTGYNWTSVTVIFVPAATNYSNGVPELSWSPPQAVNVTNGLLSNFTKYVNIPITSGSVAVGTNITGSIWAKYQLQVGERVSYANMSSAVIAVKR